LIVPRAGTGAYQLTGRDGEALYFVSMPDPGESEMQPCSDEERQTVLQRTGLRPFGQADDASTQAKPTEVWWLFLLAVVGFLLAEIWLTRRQVKTRTPATVH
jgi:hypothetical protein